MPSMPDVLVYGDTVRHAELRHELPLVVPDPFLYAEADGQRHVIVGSLERARIAAHWAALTFTPSRSSATTSSSSVALSATPPCSR